jgi:hypothetical protein
LKPIVHRKAGSREIQRGAKLFELGKDLVAVPLFVGKYLANQPFF